MRFTSVMGENHQRHHLSLSLLVFCLHFIIITTLLLDQSHTTCNANNPNHHQYKHHLIVGTGGEDDKNVKVVGTRMTGVGSRSKKNRSIFLQSSSKSHDAPISSSPIKGRMYVKLTEQGELLLLFPSKEIIAKKNNNDNDKNKKEDGKKIMGTILSLSTKNDYNPLNFDGDETNNNMSSIYAQIWNKSMKQSQNEKKKKKRKRNTKKTSYSHLHDHHNLSEEWIPIEGIYGVYNLPSGPYLVLITDSETVYQSPRIIQATTTKPLSSSPLINLRRVKSMEIVPLPNPSSKNRTENLHHYSIEEEKNQFHLLRESFKEHDFYYSSPQMIHTTTTTLDCSEGDSESHSGEKNSNTIDDIVIRDITHTLQRFFVHLSSLQQRGEDVKEKKEQNKVREFMGSYIIDMESSLLLMSRNDLLCQGDEQFHLRNATDDQVKGIKGNRSFILMDEKSCNFHNILNESSNVQHSYRLCTTILSLPNVMSEEKNRDSHEVNDSDGQNSLETSWWTSLLKNIDERDNNSFSSALQPDSRFFWNEECIKPFLQELYQTTQFDSGKESEESSWIPYHLLLEYTIPVTSAFVGVQRNIKLTSKPASNNVSSIRYDQLLISRRSKYRAGTRFTKRGADGIGDVANFAETEQICIVWNDTTDDESVKGETIPIKECLELYAHVQTRGSIPLRWSSPTDMKTYRPKVLIGTDPVAQARALRSHLVEQMSIYSSQSKLREDKVKLVFVNLIDKHSDQGRLGRTFGAVLDAVLTLYQSGNYGSEKSNQGLSHNLISHVWFDFHAECKKGRWYRLRNLLDDVASTLDNQGYFCATTQRSMMDWTVERIQDGVIRTNCMDCLDRTNVVQSMFGRYMLFKQFNERYNSHLSRKRRLPLEFIIGFKKDSLTLPWKNGELSHRLLWADNADAISRLYAGTPALKGDFTRTGMRTKRGALDDGLNSVTRFYRNNFLDGDRQKGMDLLTGFSKFQINYEDEDHSYRSKFSVKTMKASQRAPFIPHHKLNLGWLPGDLESHLRSAALTAQTSNMAVEKSIRSDSFSSAEALSDIGRRGSLEKPWWIDVNEKSIVDANKSSPLLSTVALTNSGYVLGALLALNHAPIATVIAIICLLSPGITMDHQ